MQSWSDRTGRHVRRRYALCVGALLVPVALLLGLCGWARSSQAGVWPYRIGVVGWLAGLGPCSTIRDDRIVLHLRPGGCGPFTPGGLAPGDIPPGEVALRLPRYPGAAATDRAPAPVLSFPLDGYLKEASAMLLAPSGDPQVVADWYAERLARLGYRSYGSGSGMDATGSISETVASQEFTWQGQSERQVQVLVEAAGSGQTLLLLEAHSPAPPPRPRASLILPGLMILLVDYRVQGTPAQARQWAATAGLPGADRPWHRAVRDGPTLARIARLLNALPMRTGISSAVPDPRVTALTFRARDGRAMIFTLAQCCAGIQAPGLVLDDTRGAVGDAVAALALRR